MHQKPLGKMISVGGHTVHPEETIVSEPFWVHRVKQSPNCTPKLENISLFYSINAFKIATKILCCELLGNIPDLLFINTGLESKYFDNSSTVNIWGLKGL